MVINILLRYFTHLATYIGDPNLGRGGDGLIESRGGASLGLGGGLSPPK